ncbi:hypothetical protein N7456_000095 [Penicillium angulare]|uniref:Uncharacterized protein n=1 Tax=Penicillium angulare TaxID=116970 RepID=A0A9W9GBW4_9EURO|nr:hypothetical protein N7456_000095 [Penicillium angulare]
MDSTSPREATKEQKDLTPLAQHALAHFKERSTNMILKYGDIFEDDGIYHHIYTLASRNYHYPDHPLTPKESYKNDEKAYQRFRSDYVADALKTLNRNKELGWLCRSEQREVLGEILDMWMDFLSDREYKASIEGASSVAETTGLDIQASPTTQNN